MHYFIIWYRKALGKFRFLLAESKVDPVIGILGIVGAVILLAMIPIRRKMDGKPAIVFNGRAIATTIFGVFGAIVFGVGMCMTMIWGMLIPGIAVGIVGIVLLICLIPLVKGLK